MYKVLACVLVTLGVSLASSSSEDASYDQRQHGELNIHVHVSDVELLAFLDGGLLGGDGDYDYSYDYEDPVDESVSASSATSSLSTATASSSQTLGDVTTPDSATTGQTLGDVTTPDSPSTGQTLGDVTTPAISSTGQTLGDVPATPSTGQTLGDVPATPSSSQPLSDVTTPKREGNVTTTDVPSTTHKTLLGLLLSGDDKKHGSRRRCGAGFYRDSRGRCRRVRKPNYQMLQRLPIELP
ncbi:hypothetical protein L9F63_025042, partial [Diploptera punctata]